MMKKQKLKNIITQNNINVEEQNTINFLGILTLTTDNLKGRN